MDSAQIWELIGYLGSLIVVISLLMTSIIKLRVLNTIGSLIFTIYALVIHSYPTAAMNAALILINLYFLRKALQPKSFRMVETDVKNGLWQSLLAPHADDMENFFPDWKQNINEVTRAFFHFQGDTLAGVTLLTGNADNAGLLVDYSTPSYRDFKLGTWVYHELPLYGISKVTYYGTSAEHIAYLKKMGFEQADDVLTKKL